MPTATYRTSAVQLQHSPASVAAHLTTPDANLEPPCSLVQHFVRSSRAEPVDCLEARERPLLGWLRESYNKSSDLAVPHSCLTGFAHVAAYSLLVAKGYLCIVVVIVTSHEFSSKLTVHRATHEQNANNNPASTRNAVSSPNAVSRVSAPKVRHQNPAFENALR